MSNRFITIDQSLSKCAWIFWKNGKPIDKGVIMTGDSSAKVKKKGVAYFSSVDERINYIGDTIIAKVEEHIEDLNFNCPVIFEGLSFGSVGSATRDLAGLYYVLRYMFHKQGVVEFADMEAYSPITIKSIARSYLPILEQTEVSPKTGKHVKVKMDKKLMVRACEIAAGQDFLKGYNFSNGKDDLADAYWLGRKYLITTAFGKESE